MSAFRTLPLQSFNSTSTILFLGELRQSRNASDALCKHKGAVNCEQAAGVNPSITESVYIWLEDGEEENLKRKLVEQDSSVEQTELKSNPSHSPPSYIGINDFSRVVQRQLLQEHDFCLHGIVAADVESVEVDNNEQRYDFIVLMIDYTDIESVYRAAYNLSKVDDLYLFGRIHIIVCNARGQTTDTCVGIEIEKLKNTYSIPVFYVDNLMDSPAIGSFCKTLSRQLYMATGRLDETLMIPPTLQSNNRTLLINPYLLSSAIDTSFVPLI